MIFQPLRPFEFTSPVIDKINFPLLTLKPFSTIIFSSPGLRKVFTKRIINERILEIPFVLSNIKSNNKNILDIGSNESPISLMLASLGHTVTALDIRGAQFNHPNLINIKKDITVWNKPDYFNVVICLSTLEHIGLDVYGGFVDNIADQKAINNIYKSLKPGGSLLLTVPASFKKTKSLLWRSYDQKSLNMILNKFRKVKIIYGIRDNSQNWTIVSKISSNHIYDPQTPSGVALIEAIK